MTLAALSIEEDIANAVIGRFREVTGLVGELKGSRIGLAERGLLFELLDKFHWKATVGIAISALAPEVGQDRGAHDTDIYAQLLNDAVASMVSTDANCIQIVIDDGRYGPETLALIRKDIAESVGPCGTASLGLSHRHAGLQIADVIANTFFNRAMVTERQARMAAIVAPFLQSGKVKLHLLSGNTQGDDQGGE
jgi:hypothetical protein